MGILQSIEKKGILERPEFMPRTWIREYFQESVTPIFQCGTKWS